MLGYRTYIWPPFILLSAVFLVFMAPGVRFMASLSPGLMRWVVAALSAAWVLFFNRRTLGRFYNTDSGRSTLVFGLWCLVTSAWSEAAQLSFSKASAQLMVLLGVPVLAYSWGHRAPLMRVLDPLFAAMLMTFAAALLGQGQAGATIGEIGLYQGLTTNPNVFGTMVAMVGCLILWRSYLAFQQRSGHLRRLFWGFSILAVPFFLYRAGSRAAFAAFLITSLTALLVQPSGVIQRTILSVFAAIFIVAVVDDGIFGILESRLVYKTTDALSEAYGRRDVFYTRDAVWKESVAGAEAGGVFGVGYAVHHGSEMTTSEFDVTSVGYGREKGNSQLAVVEEVGLVGLVLYSLILVRWGRLMFSALLASKSRDEKTLLAIVLGAFLGINFQSAFEQWWVSPGSQEYAFVFVLLALGQSLSERIHFRSIGTTGLRRQS